MSNEVCLYLYVSDFYKLFIYFWTMSTFFRVMGLPLSWSVDNHSSTNNDSDMNMKNILSLQRNMDMKLAFYIFLWVFYSSSSCIPWEYIWQKPFLLQNFNPFFMKEILPFWLFGLILPFFRFVTAVVGDDDETEKPLLKCYVCSGVNNVCGDAADLGTETTWSPERNTESELNDETLSFQSENIRDLHRSHRRQRRYHTDVREERRICS